MDLYNILHTNDTLVGEIVGIKSLKTSVYVILVKGRKLTAYCQEELQIGDYVYLIPNKNEGSNCFKLEKIIQNGNV